MQCELEIARILGHHHLAFAITIVKGILPYALQTIADFAGGIITNFASNYLATLMLLLIPIFVMIPAIVYMIYVLYFLSKFIQVVWPALLLLGGFLYGLPVRLGRKWGAVLIAVTMVMYVGLPLMPAFVSTMTSTQNAQSLLADMQTDYNKVLSLVEQYGGTDIIFQIQPRQYGRPGGAPYMAAPDFARIQISGGGAPDRYIWTDGHGNAGWSSSNSNCQKARTTSGYHASWWMHSVEIFGFWQVVWQQCCILRTLSLTM